MEEGFGKVFRTMCLVFGIILAIPALVLGGVIFGIVWTGTGVYGYLSKDYTLHDSWCESFADIFAS